MNIVFKRGERTGLDVLLSGSDEASDTTVHINDRLLDFDKSHEHNACWLSKHLHPQQSTTEQFSCYHIVEHLYKQILEERGRDQPGLDRSKISELCLLVSENLSQMPISVKVESNAPRQVQVAWTDLDSDMARLHDIVPLCRIVLHREETCGGRRDDLFLQSKSNVEMITEARRAALN